MKSLISHDHDAEYDSFINNINTHFNALTGPIFQTNVDSDALWAAYLSAFPEGAEREYHNCSCCRGFIKHYGALGVVQDDGMIAPAVFDSAALEVPERYVAAIAAMGKLVRRAKITMPFLSSAKQYGEAARGERKDGLGLWHHFAIVPAPARVFKSTGLKTAYQVASEKREEFGSVAQAILEYSKATCETALRLLKDDQLQNSEAAVGQAQFLVDLHNIPAGHGRNNLQKRAVAMAPNGFCHPRSSMIATLLDDIQGGASFEDARRRWNAKMHPLQYQRPQAAPNAGAIKAAEEAFAKLGAASALKRRIATLDDVLEKLWIPKAAEPAGAGGGIFASVKAKGEVPVAPNMRAPAIAMTWDKFQRTVMRDADQIEVMCGHGYENYSALTTAVDPDALPLLQWDSAERRNPVAWYVWNGGSPASQWGLSAGQFHKLSAVTLKPHQWFGGEYSHHQKGVFFLIEGARETRNSGSAIFPSLLKGDFHGYRAVIEAYSQANNLEGLEQGSACGLVFSGENSVLLRVTSGSQVSEYKIDRWD